MNVNHFYPQLDTLVVSAKEPITLYGETDASKRRIFGYIYMYVKLYSEVPSGN